MQLTEEQKKKYLEEDANLCPFCNSQDIVGNFVAVDGRECSQNVYCIACGEHWTDIYKLADVETYV